MKVTLIMAMTADGYIARTPDHLTDWTDIEDKNFFTEKTKEIGTVIMGSNTWKTLPGPLEGRLNIVMSSAGNLADPIEKVLEFSAQEPRELLDALAKRGIDQVAMVGGAQSATSFILDNLIDEFFLTLSPQFFGQGISLLEGRDLETRLELIDSQQIGDGSLLLHYSIVKHE